jgi:hypothetical protein
VLYKLSISVTELIRFFVGTFVLRVKSFFFLGVGATSRTTYFVAVLIHVSCMLNCLFIRLAGYRFIIILLQPGPVLCCWFIGLNSDSRLS